MVQKIDYIEYDPETLKRLQSTLLMMLEDFISVCEKNDIDYFVAGGTALGAIRHKGIIPWDDDIDIAYRRSDEDRIIALMREEYGDKYWFINPKIDPSFPYLPTHMCLKGTVFKEKIYTHDYKSGVFLDLYPLDDVYEDACKRFKQVLLAWLWGKLYIMYFVSNPVLYYEGWKAKLVRCGCAVGNRAMHLLRIRPSFLYKKALKYSLECSLSEHSSQLFMWPHNPTPFMCLLKKDDVFPARVVPFNHLNVCVPRNVEDYLKAEYGDFMTPPPEEKRHNHPPEKLVL